MWVSMAIIYTTTMKLLIKFVDRDTNRNRPPLLLYLINIYIFIKILFGGLKYFSYICITKLNNYEFQIN